MSAIGYSFGWLVLKLQPLKRILKRLVYLVIGIAGIRYSLPPVTAFVATLPSVNPSVVAMMAASGFLLFGAAAFCYVLFSFMVKIAKTDPGIRQDIQQIAHKLAHPLKAAVGAPAESAGSFHPYSEDRAYLQEQFDTLVQAKILRPEDDLDKILKDGEIDLEFLKERGVGA